MKPVKIFLFFISTLLILAAASWFIPAEGYDILGWEVHFFKFPEGHKPAVNYIDSIPENPTHGEKEIGIPDKSLAGTDTTSQIKRRLPVKKYDTAQSLIFPSDSIDYMVLLKEEVERIDSLGKPLRIMYYGDSQIENDRITSAFRDKLQERYGGSGRGLVPVSDIYNSANNFVMTVSNNWEETTVVGARGKNLDVGLLGESFRVTNSKAEADSTTAWVKIRSLQPQKPGGYTVACIFYMASGKSSIKITLDERRQYAQKLSTKGYINELRLNLGATPEIMKAVFSTDSEITVYGLSLESPKGIIVDNIALRGRAFPGFSMMDTTRFKQMANLIKPSFLILHYGVNVVPNVRNNYFYYKKQLKGEIAYINKQLPEVPLLLISSSDMAHKVNGRMQSYSNISAVVQAQKEAALESGCAFWNLFNAMGGSGSMIRWVEKQPPLGNKDYVHFTMLGAKKVGNLFAAEFLKSLEGGETNELIANE
ncbi:hypothetical protein MNBD_BACTEROID01-1848 [hydrothermal vent metagenome]|uniref:Periplasmic protein n=1 Tax=hydrothermal vent metagenome TaxID=652676 RepID=A0A3B0TJQ0_9ZZZZ